jgi:hypothetical protein
MALLAALVLLALSAALAVATFSAALAMRHAALTARARARVETEVRRAVAEVLASWSAALDTMPIGSGMAVALGGIPPSAGAPLVRSARVDRVADGLYAVTVDMRAFASERPLARRRARLWLEQPAGPPPPGGPPGASAPPPVVTPWGLDDLY